MSRKFFQKITLVSMFAGITIPSADADFSQFRGVGGSGVVRNQDIPTEWSAEKNLAWKVAVPGAGWSQPVIWKQLLFVTTAVADKEMRPKDFAGGVRMPQSMGLGGLSAAPKVEIQWQVHCYNTTDGQLIWKQTVVEGRPEHPIHPSNTYATESPVVDEKGVYVFFGATGTMAGLSHDGSPLWKKELGAFPTNNGFGTGSSLAIHDGRVFAQHFTEKSASLTCVNAQSGDVVWSDNRDKFGKLVEFSDRVEKWSSHGTDFFGGRTTHKLRSSERKQTMDDRQSQSTDSLFDRQRFRSNLLWWFGSDVQRPVIRDALWCLRRPDT
jgi:outer membrane protein assembly factor BamB